MKQPVCCAGGFIITNRGDVIEILHAYAGFEAGRTIHSSAKIEEFNLCVDEKSVKFGGSQGITNPEVYVIPLDIKLAANPHFFRPRMGQSASEMKNVIYVYLNIT